MSDFMLMEPSNQALKSLLGNGVKYNVPRFQRDYAWDLEQWEDLWADIETLDDEKHHYMGYIVLQSKPDNSFDVIDGQQRLVTMSLIILAAMSKIKQLIDEDKEKQENQKRLDLFYDRLVGSFDTMSLSVDSKLTLNRNNAKYYKDICSDLKPAKQIRMTKTNVALKQAFEFFSKKEMGQTGFEIAAFIEGFSARMIFTKIVVVDGLNAYKVFETLNARGVKLSTPDLLKNYIFSVITQNDDVTDEALDELDDEWTTILTQLGEGNFTDFVRYHHNFQQKSVSAKDLFKATRNLLNQKPEAYAYLKSLKTYAPIYAALQEPYNEWWSVFEMQGVKHDLEGLQLFKISQPFVVLMAAHKAFSAEEFVLTLKYLYVLSVRYNVVLHLSPKEQERRYNAIAVKIFDGTHKRASHIKNSEDFKALYPKDDAFKSAFTFCKIPSRSSAKKIRFLLADIENHFGRETDYQNVTLEHICPYNPDDGWQTSFGNGVNDISDRLGNLVLLTKDDLKRSAFEDKKTFYAESGFRLATKITEYDNWDLENLNRYQEWLADQAAKTWRVDYS